MLKDLIKTNGDKLYASALICLGRDASPKDKADDEYGCADSVSEVIKILYPDFIGSISTAELFNVISKDKRFIRVKNDIKAGDIIISPTGLNKTFENPNMKNGHTGIVGEGEVIMSNSSATGLWTANYTLASWVKRYRELGGYKIYCFRAI